MLGFGYFLFFEKFVTIMVMSFCQPINGIERPVLTGDIQLFALELERIGVRSDAWSQGGIQPLTLGHERIVNTDKAIALLGSLSRSLTPFFQNENFNLVFSEQGEPILYMFRPSRRYQSSFFVNEVCENRMMCFTAS